MQNKQAISYKDATGVIQYNMTNDYMFRYVLQKNEKVLRGLICSLLHLKPAQIKTVRITNPINLSENIDGKEFVLDIDILLNDDTQINLEILPVIHIGFLDYTLFPDTPEFYATNMLTNVKTHRIYNDKFRLSVVDLTKIELATEEDKAYQIDYWARLFKAETWEDLKMLAEISRELRNEEAAQSVYVANADEIVRQKCYARQMAIGYELSLKDMIAEKDAENAELKAENFRIKSELAEKETELARLRKLIEENKCI